MARIAADTTSLLARTRLVDPARLTPPVEAAIGPDHAGRPLEHRLREQLV